jgi:hypothetical protein
MITTAVISSALRSGGHDTTGNFLTFLVNSASIVIGTEAIEEVVVRYRPGGLDGWPTKSSYRRSNASLDTLPVFF